MSPLGVTAISESLGFFKKIGGMASFLRRQRCFSMIIVFLSLKLVEPFHLLPGNVLGGRLRSHNRPVFREHVSKSSINMKSPVQAPQKSTMTGISSAIAGLLSGFALMGAIAGVPSIADAGVSQSAPSTQQTATSCSSKHWSAILLATTEDTGGGFADLPPCLPWSSGPCVSVNGPCFADEVKGCGLSFKECAKDKARRRRPNTLPFAAPGCNHTRLFFSLRSWPLLWGKFPPRRAL